MIRWFTNNGIAANFLMLGILVAGVFTAIYRVPLEVTPALSWNTVMITMPYRGGTAKDVEQAILIPIEEALEGVKGIDRLNADGSRGEARFHLVAKPGVDLRALLDDVKGRVDTINTFPSETERPRIFIPDSTSYFEVLNIAVTGDLSRHELGNVARKVYEDVIQIDGISRAEIQGNSKQEIAIEADAEKLQSYGLSFQDLADAIRRFSIDLPAGAIDSDSGTFIVRTRGQAYSAGEFENVPIRSVDGSELLVGDVATVKDWFEDSDKRVEFNGRPAMFIEIMRTGNESAIDISNKVHEYVRNSKALFPDGIELFVWDDESRSIRGRLSTLMWSMLQGSLLVMIVLGLFLRPALAFWIVIGIPVGFAGGILFMPYMGVTANVMSLFGFIIVLGIVVDDAIVTGENVYSKIKEGMPPAEAAIEGTHEVATPVTFGALTTMVAFIPLLFFDGTWGDFARQIPPIVAPVLLFSLIESKFILPAHLKHLRLKKRRGFLSRMQTSVSGGLELFIERIYRPSLEIAVSNRAAVIASFCAVALGMVGYCWGGRLGFVSFPSVDRQRITAMLDLPDNTQLATTAKYMDRLQWAIEQLRDEFVDPGTGQSLIQNVSRTVGARSPGRSYDKSRGYLSVEILSPDLRSEPGPKNNEIANRLKELVGEIPEATSFRIYAESNLDKGDDNDDEFLNLELRGPASPQKAEVAQQIKKMLEGYEGIRDAWARVNYGQDELELSLKPRAAELGLTQAMLAQQIRQAFFGEEAQRLQRGVEDIRVMVRLPKEQRESLHTLEQLKITTPRGANVPLQTVARIDFTKAPSFVERNDGAEVIRCGAQGIDETVDLVAISKAIAPKLDKLCNDNNLTYQYTGYVAEAEDAQRQTLIGAVLLLFTLYGMLSIPLKSLVQPFFVMLAVPFAIIGALLGHIFMDLTPSYLSVFGMLALAGIAVNDTLVMVDYVNRRRSKGASLRNAALEAGEKRFRPIMLTSVTTFMGLLPLMMERSLQAQFLIPMAVSLAFGVLFATIVTLYLIPCSLLLAQDLKSISLGLLNWYLKPFQRQDSVKDSEQSELSVASVTSK
ncbi:MAG: efflux RND transporter permease subunit [Planctomycetota bacterium]|nr:efflux RND transporter permease subunit [Planctomycetota bacterium]